MLLPILTGLWEEHPLSLKGLDRMKVPYLSAGYPDCPPIDGGNYEMGTLAGGGVRDEYHGN